MFSAWDCMELTSRAQSTIITNVTIIKMYPPLVLQPISICDRIPMDGHGNAGHGDLKTGQNEEEDPGFKKAGMGVCGGGKKSLNRRASRLLLEYVDCVLILHLELKRKTVDSHWWHCHFIHHTHAGRGPYLQGSYIISPHLPHNQV